MHKTQAVRIESPVELRGSEAGHVPRSGPAPLHEWDRDEQFLSMLRSFRRSGGLARSDDVASLLASRSGLNIGTLARWMVEGEVIHFDWQHETWFPMFQFGRPDMSPNVGVGRVLQEIRDVFDPWEIAHWFARPCAFLAGRTPADSMELDPNSVLHAARFERRVVDT
jgi:hypothetical protein